MTTAVLGDLCTVQIGRTPKRSESRYWGGELPWVSISDLGGSRQLVETKECITEVGAEESNSKLLPAGTLMLSFKLSLGKRGFAGVDLYTNEAIAGLLDLDTDRVDPVYLYWYLGAFDYESMVDRAAMGKTLNKGKVQRIPVLLPPLPEQKRIAATLDAAYALRTKRRESLDQLDELVQSVFLDMFGDPVTNPKGWEEGPRLGDVAEIASGITKGRKLRGQPTREVPYLAVVNVQDREIVLDPLKTIHATEAEIDRYALQTDDLLLTEGGDPDKLGRGALWAGQLHECIHQNHIFRVRLTSDCLRPLFLSWLISSPRGKRYFARHAKQTTGIASINMTQLRGFPVLLPPVGIQTEFAEAAGAIQRLRGSVESHLAELDTLFASLQSRAFRGEL